MGSPWPCAAAVADTSGVHSYHTFPPVIGNQHRQDSAPFFGVAYVPEQDSGFFDNNEDLNGVSSNSSGPLPLQKTRSSNLQFAQGTGSTMVRSKELCHSFSNYFNPHSHIHADTTILRYSAQNSPPQSNSPSQQDEPARKRLRFRGNCVLSLREIPTWNIYYHDQRRQLIKFSDNNKGCSRDPILNKRVSLSFYKNVLVKLDVDAVVCSVDASYSREAGGMSGSSKSVAKLLNEEAGQDLGEACNRLPKCEVGSVVVTDGFMLPARFIFHVNGPDIHTYAYEEVLRRSYENCLNLLIERELRTIAIPCISTSRKGIPKNIAAGIALSTVRRFMEQHKDKVDRVVFALRNKKDIDIYLRLMQIYFPVE